MGIKTIQLSARRQLKDYAFFYLIAAAGLLSMLTLLMILAVIFYKGLPALNINFIVTQIEEVGASGGILYNILGSLILILTTLVITVPLAVGIALVYSVYLNKYRWLRQLFYLLLNLLNSTPSIIFGILGMIVFIAYLDMGKSWLSGGVILAAMIVPGVAVALIERMETVPRPYIEAAYSMGLSQGHVVWSVILPYSFNGLLTGTLLGLARALGETAPIIFTATIFSGATIPDGIKENPVLSLPYHIFVLAQESFNPAISNNLWGTALVLVGVVTTMSLLALPLRLKIHEEAHG